MNTQTQNDTANDLPPVEKVTDSHLAQMYSKRQLVNEALVSTEKAGTLTVRTELTKLLNEMRDLESLQCNLIHNLFAEIGRLRKFGFGAE